VRIAVISDTHMSGGGRVLPAACLERLRGADLIVHAGDWSDMATLGMVRALGPLVAVFGNVEDPAVRAALPATAEAEVADLRIGVVHNGGPEAGRLERMRRRFPGVGGVVFGHSHIPLYEVADDGFFILNPGSPTDRRRSPRHSMAEIEVPEGAPPAVCFLAVDDPAGPLPADLVRGMRG
jgi:putative phosphoesterase